jgi:hypothetical protein
VEELLAVALAGCGDDDALKLDGFISGGDAEKDGVADYLLGFVFDDQVGGIFVGEGLAVLRFWPSADEGVELMAVFQADDVGNVFLLSVADVHEDLSTGRRGSWESRS